MVVCSIKVGSKKYVYKLTFSLYAEIVSSRSSSQVATNSPKTSQMASAPTLTKKRQTFSSQATSSITKGSPPQTISSKTHKASRLATRTDSRLWTAPRTMATQRRQIASMRLIRAGQICCNVLEICKATKARHQLQWLRTSPNMRRVRTHLTLRLFC